MKLSKHSKQRMRERTDLNHKERQRLFRYALDNGKDYHHIKDEEVRKYVKNRSSGCKIKLYQDYMFLYSKNKHRLYTMYRLPEELVGKEK